MTWRQLKRRHRRNLRRLTTIHQPRPWKTHHNGRLRIATGRNNYRVEQMNLVAALCAAHQKEISMAGVFVLKHSTTGEIHGVYATCGAADDARDDLRTDADPDLGDEYQIESWAVSA